MKKLIPQPKERLTWSWILLATIASLVVLGLICAAIALFGFLPIMRVIFASSTSGAVYVLLRKFLADGLEAYRINESDAKRLKLIFILSFFLMGQSYVFCYAVLERGIF